MSAPSNSQIILVLGVIQYEPFLARLNARTPTLHTCHTRGIVSVWESRDTYPSKKVGFPDGGASKPHRSKYIGSSSALFLRFSSLVCELHNACMMSVPCYIWVALVGCCVKRERVCKRGKAQDVTCVAPGLWFELRMVGLGLTNTRRLWGIFLKSKIAEAIYLFAQLVWTRSIFCSFTMHIYSA
jgi:hypothetical protein